MPEYYQIKNHPLSNELEKRASRIVWRLVFFRYSTRALYQAQVRLIKELQLVEEGIRYFKEEITSAKQMASTLATNIIEDKGSLSTGDKAEIKSLQLEAEHLKLERQILQFGRWLFRYIGDGIAWRAYGHNRQVIRALGSKQPVPFSSGKEGFKSEMKVFKAVRNLGKDWFPLMHDITNCLRTGDFSIFHKGQFNRIIEVKVKQSRQNFIRQNSLKNIGRSARQADRLNRIFKLLETGDLSQLHPELKHGLSIRSSVPEKHNFEAISNAIKLSRKNGFGLQEPERGLLYLAWNMENWSEDKVFQKAIQAHPHIFDTKLEFRSISPRYDAYHLSMPITAMALPSSDILDILFGRIALIVMVNYKCLEEFCQNKGLPLKIEVDDQKEAIRITVNTQPYGVAVAQGFWDRVMLEGLTFESFVGLTQGIYEDKRIEELL